jgi:hypothetical protein
MERREAERREMERVEAERERQAAERLDAQRREMERRSRIPTGPPDAFGPTRQERGGRRALTGPPPFDGDYPTQNPANRTADMALDPMLAQHGSQAMYYPPTTRHAPTGPPPYTPPGSPYGPGNPTASTYHPYPNGPMPSRYNSVPPGYGSMTGGQVGGTQGGALGSYLARYRKLSTPKRVLVILAPFCVAAASYLLLFDTPAPAPATQYDGGDNLFAANPQPIAVAPVQTPTAPTQAEPPPQPPTAPAPVGCPPGFVPYPMPVAPGAAIPCVPANTPMPGAPTATTTTTAPAPSPDPSAAVAVRTLERQAVDFVAANDYAHAAAVYEMLQQQNPANRVYAEAARILRNKADGGIPPL